MATFTVQLNGQPQTVTVDDTVLENALNSGDGSALTTRTGDENDTSVGGFISGLKGDNSPEAQAVKKLYTDAMSDGNISESDMMGIMQGMNQYASKMKLAIKREEIAQAIRSGAIDAIRY